MAVLGSSEDQRMALTGLQKQLKAGEKKLGVLGKAAAERRAEKEEQKRQIQNQEQNRLAGTTAPQQAAALAERQGVRAAGRARAKANLMGGTALAGGRAATRSATEASAKARLGAANILDQRRQQDLQKQRELSEKVRMGDTMVADEEILQAGKITQIASEEFKAKQNIAAGVEGQTTAIEKMIADTAGMVLEDEDLDKMLSNLDAMTAASPEEEALIEQYKEWVKDAKKTNWSFGKASEGQNKIEAIMG